MINRFVSITTVGIYLFSKLKHFNDITPADILLRCVAFAALQYYTSKKSVDFNAENYLHLSKRLNNGTYFIIIIWL